MSEPRPIADRVRYVVYGIMPGSNRKPIELCRTSREARARRMAAYERQDTDWAEVWLARETAQTVILKCSGKPEAKESAPCV